MSTRVAIVAGGAKGLGEAIASRLARDGDTVVIADVDERRAVQAAGDLTAAGLSADAMTVDVTDEGEVAAMVDAAVERHGRLDTLVCSAAVEVRKPLTEMSDDEWQNVLDVNLKGPFLCMKHGIPRIAQSGGGAVILMGSTLGHIGQPGFSAYCASKGALVNLCKQAAIEHAPDQVRINVLSPSATDTGLFMEFARQTDDPDAIVRMVTDNNPMRRLGTGAEVADTVAFLASPAAAYISGCAIPMDGGLAGAEDVIMRDGMRVLDADAHVVEPGEVFGDFSFDGAIDLVPTTPFEMVGDSSKLADFLASGCSSTEYLKCLDREGIDAVVLYPSIGLFVPFQSSISAAQSADACRSYNEWIADYASIAPSRMVGVGLVPLADIGDAVKVLGQALDLGLPGVMVRPNHMYGRSLGDRYYDPLYAAIAEAGAVLSVHEGLGLTGGPTFGIDRSALFAVRHALSHPMEQMASMASLMLEGSLERHPELRVAFLESGTGWLTWWLGRLDEHAEWMADTECKELSLRPSEYFRRQCVISSDPEDPLAGYSVSNYGADHVVWASDFPHPDAKYPEALTEFCKEAAEQGIGDEDLRTLLWDTPVSFYRLEERFAA